MKNECLSVEQPKSNCEHRPHCKKQEAADSGVTEGGENREAENTKIGDGTDEGEPAGSLPLRGELGERLLVPREPALPVLPDGFAFRDGFPEPLQRVVKNRLRASEAKVRDPTRWSTAGPMSTKAPKAATFVTAPSRIMPGLRSLISSTPSLNTAALKAGRGSFPPLRL